MIKKKITTVMIVFTVLVLLAMCSREFMFRATVFIYSPKSAITMEYKEKNIKNEGKDLCVITKNAPIEEATQAPLNTWIVYHFGPLKFVRYYGEG